MKQKHYVYVLQRRDKKGIFKYQGLEFNYEPFYVGKGSIRSDNDKVKYDRLWYTIHNGNDHKMHLTKKIKYDIEITIFEKNSENEAYDYESEVIKIIGRKDENKGPLTNWCDGGRMHVDPKSHFSQVAQYDRDGNFIQLFESQNAAVEAVGNGNISRACGLGLLCANYFWRTVKKGELPADRIETEEYFKNRMHDGNKKRKVIVYKNDEKIEFEAIKDASEYTGVGSPTICRACKNERTYNGFRFEYA